MIKINLIPASEIAKRKWDTQRVLLFALSGAMIIGMSFLIGMDIYEWYNYSTLLKKIEYSIERVNKDIQKVELSMSKDDRYLKSLASLISSAEPKSHSIVPFLLFVTADIPSGMWLESLDFSGSVAKVQGKAFLDDSVGDFISKLRDSGVVSSISMPVIRHVEGSLGVSEFSFECKLKRGTYK
ncbi:MAG: PilN domain-containing protein [Synergistetes bacterium]|nr:PilN domain-containing protein [Synergistota bacterium]